MLFNSYFFLLIFLPVVFFIFQLISRLDNKTTAITWLVIASLLFYVYWNPVYLYLIASSILFNYVLSIYLEKTKLKTLLIFGLITNVALLCYFKYFNFFIENINGMFEQDFFLVEPILLPLAISFFTFQQIAYLVDVYNHRVKVNSFLYYCLFITFFPQLIAGPIVHYTEIIPQLVKKRRFRIQSSNFLVGMSLFFLGLFKKVCLADTIAPYSDLVFSIAESDLALHCFSAWFGAVSYAFQIYFDFSGYSDMATGLARVFGIVLPINFYSPYKATSIIDFWRRWHITLSNFLRDYIYIPLGGNKIGNFNKYKNICITMLLGGFWHGAGWTFIIWGGVHGVFLIINHAWKNTSISQKATKSKAFLLFNHALTFFCIVISWVIFRAETMDGVKNMYYAMLGFNVSTGTQPLLSIFMYKSMPLSIIVIATMFWITFFLPNSMQFFYSEAPSLGLKVYCSEQPKRLLWKRNLISAVLMAIIASIGIMFIQQESVFLYFQF